jgi:D-proline reductase (dithiol) PrdB
MPRLDRLPQINRNNLLTFPAQVNDGAPFVAPTKPLAECRLAIVTTAGLHRRGDRLFGPGDPGCSTTNTCSTRARRPSTNRIR